MTKHSQTYENLNFLEFLLSKKARNIPATITGMWILSNHIHSHTDHVYALVIAEDEY